MEKIENLTETMSKTIILQKQEKKKDKRYANYYLHESTIDKIDKIRKKTNFNKSELVDYLLNEAFSRVEVRE